MGVHRVASRFATIVDVWTNYNEVLDYRKLGRQQRLDVVVPCAPLCSAVTKRAILIDAISFIVTSFYKVNGLSGDTVVPTNVALRKLLLPDYEQYHHFLLAELSAITRATDGAPIVFYFDGECLSGREVAIQQKASTQVSRRSETMQRILTMAGHLSGELQIAKRDIHLIPSKLRWCAEEALREINNTLPNVKVFNCLGEADPYLAHDGQFAALVVSDDTDLVMTPGILVSANDGIQVTDEGVSFRTRSVSLIAETLGLSNIGQAHIAELASFTGNDYTRSLLESPIHESALDKVKTIQEWLFEQAQDIDTRGIDFGPRAFAIDRLVPLVESEDKLSYVLGFIQKHHPELYEAIQFTVEATLRPGLSILRTQEELISPEKKVETSAFPSGFNLIGYSQGFITVETCAEDFSEGPSISEVLLPLSAAVVASLVLSEKEDNELVVWWTYRVGISIIEGEQLELLPLLPSSYLSEQTPSDRFEVLSQRILEPLLRVSCGPPLTPQYLSQLEYDDEELFASLLMAYVTGLSSHAHDVLSFREVCALSSMEGIMLALRDQTKKQKIFLTFVTQQCDSRFMHDEPLSHGFSHSRNGFRDVTLCSRFLAVMSHLRSLCILCDVLHGGGKEPSRLFHGPLLSLLLTCFLPYDEIELSPSDTKSTLASGLTLFLSELGEVSDSEFVRSSVAYAEKVFDFLEGCGCGFLLTGLPKTDREPEIVLEKGLFFGFLNFS
jgi:hypothetical protein